MDIQVVIVFILAILTINLLVVGVYVVLVLKDLRHTLTRVNSVVNTIDNFTTSIANPMATVTSLVGAVTEGIRAVRSIRTLANYEEDDEDV